VINGEVFRGASHAAGELKWFLDDPRLGQLRLPLLGDKSSLRFGLGGLPSAAFDALERVAGAYAAGKFDLSTFDTEGGDTDLEQVRQLLAYTTLAMSSTAAILNPSVVVMTGQITRGGQMVIDLLESLMGGDVYQVPRIVHSDLGFKAVLLGAAKAILDLTALKPDTKIIKSHDVLAAAPY
jgi:predicted NBD/HSP70 family sugar kinase